MTDTLIRPALRLVEAGAVPDPLIRWGIRRLCERGIRDEATREAAARRKVLDLEMREGPIAPVPDRANEQHYEVPAAFFTEVLGPHRKYSGCYWGEGAENLGQAEEAALRITCERAGIADGHDILELGCGWGSLTLFMAARYPAARITAVSNSRLQRAYIEETARARGLANITVLTRDMNDFSIEQKFDRVVSVEMFEHMRNYRELLRRVRSWLRPDGALFVHIFCHREFLYPFRTESESDWMGRYFFTGGIMPDFDVFSRFTDDLVPERSWKWDGTHYERTANAWLANLDEREESVRALFREHYGKDAAVWFQRWRLFFLACAELFGLRKGSEWLVGHYLLTPSRS
ncbi:MAG: class I SAM-dependent methyltransferase [Gemmatimonadetes bacterium]|nr:class I SAM-dependent methyltransferase [Gemmatimonadota bacterium]